MLKSVSSSCKVSFTDGVGVTHAVSVSASSLFEAAALGVAEFKKCGFALVEAGQGTKLTVAVKSPSTTHELTVARLEAWLDTNGRSPREQERKVALRELLGRGRVDQKTEPSAGRAR